jgi:hypothetical protein
MAMAMISNRFILNLYQSPWGFVKRIPNGSGDGPLSLSGRRNDSGTIELRTEKETIDFSST